jgi:hypothetical protein
MPVQLKGTDRILPEIIPRLVEYTAQVLRRAGTVWRTGSGRRHP